MGYIDESWRVTEEGKSRLLSEQQQQQIQGSSNEASQTIGAVRNALRPGVKVLNLYYIKL